MEKEYSHSTVVSGNHVIYISRVLKKSLQYKSEKFGIQAKNQLSSKLQTITSNEVHNKDYRFRIM